MDWQHAATLPWHLLQFASGHLRFPAFSPRKSSYNRDLPVLLAFGDSWYGNRIHVPVTQSNCASVIETSNLNI
jgi:hypothetical protein